MSDATSLTAAAAPLLPLRIGSVEFDDPTLTVLGDRWSLVLMGEWTWSRAGAVVTDSDSPGAEDAVRELCGLDITAIRFPAPGFDGDCSFRLSDGRLDVRSDRSGYETWSFRHDGLDVVYVGL